MKYNRIFGLIFIFCVAMACKKNDEVIIDDNLPTCIEQILTDSTNLVSLVTIQATVVDNKIHYWLNTNFRQLDGSEFIVNEQCDTLCSFGGWINTQECLMDYNDVEMWKIVWQP